jgi:hypothetical protein
MERLSLPLRRTVPTRVRSCRKSYTPCNGQRHHTCMKAPEGAPLGMFGENGLQVAS